MGLVIANWYTKAHSFISPEEWELGPFLSSCSCRSWRGTRRSHRAPAVARPPVPPRAPTAEAPPRAACAGFPRVSIRSARFRLANRVNTGRQVLRACKVMVKSKDENQVTGSFFLFLRARLMPPRHSVPPLALPAPAHHNHLRRPLDGFAKRPKEWAKRILFHTFTGLLPCCRAELALCSTSFHCASGGRAILSMTFWSKTFQTALEASSCTAHTGSALSACRCKRDGKYRCKRDGSMSMQAGWKHVDASGMEACRCKRDGKWAV